MDLDLDRLVDDWDGGKLALRPMQDWGRVHMIIDVAGYFE